MENKTIVCFEKILSLKYFLFNTFKGKEKHVYCNQKTMLITETK